jgi:hypothetical protein
VPYKMLKFYHEASDKIIIIVIREVFSYEELKQKIIGISSVRYDHHLRFTFGYITINS